VLAGRTSTIFSKVAVKNRRDAYELLLSVRRFPGVRVHNVTALLPCRWKEIKIYHHAGRCNAVVPGRRE